MNSIAKAMEATPTIHEALAAVMGEVQAVRKGDRNTQQNFNFRGIDAVVNAVGPALRKHGVVAVPTVVDGAHEQYTTRNGANMRNTTLTITWRFYGPAGDYVEAQTMGEASDAGDKSVSKAHSVAYRTLLLQALCIPTDEPDPDASSYERGEKATTSPSADDPKPGLARQIREAAAKVGFTDNAAIKDDYAGWSQGEDINTASAGSLAQYLKQLREQVPA